MKSQLQTTYFSLAVSHCCLLLRSLTFGLLWCHPECHKPFFSHTLGGCGLMWSGSVVFSLRRRWRQMWQIETTFASDLAADANGKTLRGYPFIYNRTCSTVRWTLHIPRFDALNLGGSSTDLRIGRLFGYGLFPSATFYSQD